MGDVRLYLFGSPRVERDGRQLVMDTRKALALFAYLALAGVEQQRDALVNLLYPDSDPEGARAAFRRTLTTLRTALGEGLLSTRQEAVGLAPGASLWVDVLEFQALARQPDDLPAQARAAGLYQNDFMAGFNLRDSPTFDDWQYYQAESLRRQLDGVLDRLASALAAQGDLPGAVAAAERRTRLDPLLEEAHRQLMALYARGGQRGAALRQYRECVRILEKELGVPPLDATTQLYQQIVRGNLEDGGAAQPARESPPLESQQGMSPAQLPGQRVVPAPPLVGRGAELAALQRLLSAPPGPERFAALVGEAGIGKTRLAEEFLAQARQSGRVVVQARCYEGQLDLAYAPFLEAMQPLLDSALAAQRLAALPQTALLEIARLWPGLVKEPAPVALAEGPGAQTRFFEALRLLVNAFLGCPGPDAAPGVLFIDDMHWADSGTLDLVAYLARRAQPGDGLLLAAWRSEPGPAVERLEYLLAELFRSGRALQLPLARLSVDEITTLAGSLHPSLAADFAQRLYQESEGLPFIALEYLHLAEPAAGSFATPGSWPEDLPGGVRSLLHRRLQAPGEAARQLLSAAAVIGRSFDFHLLQAISGRSEWETVSGLEELIRLGLVREQGAGYDFSHEKLRALVYEETSAARRRLLHLRAAEELVSSGGHPRDAGAWAGLAANHFLLAGQSQRAAAFFQQAGDYARRSHANSQALAAYQSALAAGPPNPAGLHEACGDLYTLSGEYGAAVNSYQAAAAFCSPGCLPHLMHRLGEVYHRRGEWDVAEAHFRTALESAEGGADPAWQARLLADWSLTAYRANQPGHARQLAEQALGLAEQAGGAPSLAQACNVLGILARAQGSLEEASAYFERSLQAADSVDNLALRCAVLHNLARLSQERGQPAEGVALALRALEYCTLLGDRHHQAALLNTLADLHHILGKQAESMGYLKQAVALFAEIGGEAGGDQPEIWKLTEW